MRTTYCKARIRASDINTYCQITDCVESCCKPKPIIEVYDGNCRESEDKSFQILPSFEDIFYRCNTNQFYLSSHKLHY